MVLNKILFLSVITSQNNTLLIERYGERMLLHSSGVMYWKRKRWLIISDLHLGKSMHFRKRGMAIPSTMDAQDISTIRHLIDIFNPHRVILLGDLFHSDYNSEWERIASLTNEYRNGFFILVRGNHDILPDWHYGRSRLALVDEIKLGPFWFTHIPLKDSKGLINICGHLHPGIKLHGKGRQSVRLPAFFFRERAIIIPAFGRFTGSVSIKPTKTDEVVAIAEKELVRIQ